MQRVLLILLLFSPALSIPSLGQAQKIELAIPNVGARFEYLWSYGGLETYTIISVSNGRLRARLEQDFENDGIVDEVGIQYWDLNSRLWLAHMGTNYVNIYSPASNVELPSAIYDGLYFSGDFDLMSTDGITQFDSTWQSVRSSCDYLLSTTMTETQAGAFETIEMICADIDLDDDRTAAGDPASAYHYSELWSLELGMPVFQSFGIDPETGEAEDFSMLVDYAVE